MLELISEAPPSGHQPTVLLAAVHYLLLEGLDHPLAAVYAGVSDADPGPLFVDVCLRNRGRVLDMLATRHTNTNEVGRSAVLGPALTTVADELGAPLGLVDVGCSAGLNLLCDRYLLDYGAAGTTGPPDAAVRIACEVVGGHPPIASALPAIAARVGIDRDPVDVDRRRRSALAARVRVARHRPAAPHAAGARGGEANAAAVRPRRRGGRRDRRRCSACRTMSCPS